MEKKITLISGRKASNGNEYKFVSFEGGAYGYCWSLELMAGIKEGDTVDVTIDKPSHNRITAITLVKKAEAAVSETPKPAPKPAPKSEPEPKKPTAETAKAPAAAPAPVKEKNEEVTELVDDPELPPLKVAVQEDEVPLFREKEEVEATPVTPSTPMKPIEPRKQPDSNQKGAVKFFSREDIPLISAENIQVRVQRCTSEYAQCLLFRDARYDASVLDMLVGPFNWRKDYYCVNAETYCSVWIYDGEKKEWVGKSDIGSPSECEAEKGKASDAFKRACTCWGICAELYSAPNICIKGCETKITAKGTGYECGDSFAVNEIIYDADRRIKYLSIKSVLTNKTVFVWGNK